MKTMRNLKHSRIWILALLLLPGFVIAQEVLPFKKQKSGTKAGVTMEAGGAFHVNLRYSPIRMMEIGAEYMGGMKRVVGGQEGNAQRILFSCKLLFL